MTVSTREERRQQRKLERHTAQRRAARDASLRRNLVIVVGAIVIIVAAVVIVMLARGTGPATQPTVTGEIHLDDPVTARGQLYEHVPDTQPITTDPSGHYPPTFGNHYATWRPPGVYDSPVPEGNFVHDLEHGGIVILYNCPSGCPDLVNQLRGLLTSLPRSSQFNEVKLVVSPNSKIEHQLAVLAWDWQLDLDSFDGTKIRAFYDAHVDRGPEKATI
ncbi:MAG TPA: DUF3105 domain-containing protein [Chloroflexota bacterium]|nr:DUF3105 domain-containing protein [Chloroflexota bacterium]